MTQQFEVGRRFRLEINVMGGREGLERMTGAVGAEILRHRALNVLHRHGGAPTQEGRRDRGRARVGTKRSACKRSIEDGWRASESTM